MNHFDQLSEFGRNWTADHPRSAADGQFITKEHTAPEVAIDAAAVGVDEDDELDDDDEGPCRACGEPTDDGEGFDGYCGNCADARSCQECGGELDETYDDDEELPEDRPRVCSDCREDETDD